MTEVKHTPGPWVVDPDSPTDISPADDLRLGIASISHADEAGGRWEFGEQSKANAKLIAAAPNLLAALQLALDALAHCAADKGYQTLQNKAAHAANRAIAKATQ
ncbi:hypothetical protein [Pseudomonas veronii]|uniref:hypothetical protein n=1 Tax=Pseudomonas veronii TaxID=76761 RepID=UPI00061DC265|nr:hypothetical protein [Pseudomonas veronii]